MRCRADTVGLFLSFGFTQSPRAWNQNLCGLLWGQWTTETQLVCRWTGGEGSRIKRERRETTCLYALSLVSRQVFSKRHKSSIPFYPATITLSPSPLFCAFMFRSVGVRGLFYRCRVKCAGRNGSWNKDFPVAPFKHGAMRYFLECLPNLLLRWPNANIFLSIKIFKSCCVVLV